MSAQMHEAQIQIPVRMRSGIMGVLVATIILAIMAAYFAAERLVVAQTQSVAQAQHALYLRSLSEAIQQHQHLPFILAQNPLFAERVERGEGEQLNEMLQGFSDAAGLEAIYIMTPNGDVVATSNFTSDDSFLGQNYGFRPYFQGATEGNFSDYFAIGATTGRPGYFMASPLQSASGDLIGVIAIKLDIAELQSAWEERGERVLATNADGVVIVSSNPDWLYRTIGPLDEQRRDEILNSRQFADEALLPLEWSNDLDDRVLLDGQSHFWTMGQTDLVSWRVHYLSPVSATQRQILLITGVLGSVVALLFGFAVFLRSRRISAALSVSQRHRRELISTNEQLLDTQAELARTSKLAALGQLSASVTHELVQPISALKNHLLAAEIGNEITSPKTADNLKRLTARMEGITKQLRFFARQNRNTMQSVDIVSIVAEAVALLQHDIDACDIDFHWMPPADDVIVRGEQLQLEQALVNLLRNAIQAAEGSDAPWVRVEMSGITPEDLHVSIDVSDSGPGLNGLALEALQEPFFSTKSSGVGMGLGLAITSEIVREHQGVLTAQEGPAGGAVFSMTLPRHREDSE